MRTHVLFIIFFLLWAPLATAESVITIEIHENGDATWTIEKRVPLATQTDITDWEEFIQKGQDRNLVQTDLKEFKDRISWFIRSAETFSNRSMEADQFNISYGTAQTLSGAFSIISYRFDWKNFSRVDNSKIVIGDTFSEGMVLSSDNVLVITIPDGYDVEEASPIFDKREANRLIWDGTLYHSFGKGEPTLTLQRSGFGQFTWVMILFAVIALFALAVFIKRRNSSISQAKNKSPPLIYDLAAEDLSDEQMIERILIKSGGQAYQSQIVKECGLSKSKISTVLAKMKEDGHIVKIRKGKENLIRLVLK